MGKGKQWTLAEDTALAEAWVGVAEQAADGAADDRAGDTFWGSVHDAWGAALGGSQRSQQALKNHWASVQRAVRRFGGYVQIALEQQQQQEESGGDAGDGSSSSDGAVAVTPETKALALQKYSAAESEVFELEAVWEILRKSDKWHSSKTPGSALKRSRASFGADNDTSKKAVVEKRQSLSNGSALDGGVSATTPAASSAIATAMTVAGAEVSTGSSSNSSSSSKPAAKRLSLSDAALATPPVKRAHVAAASGNDRRQSAPEPPTRSLPPVPAAPAPVPVSSSSRVTSSSSSSSATSTASTRNARSSNGSAVAAVDASSSHTAYKASAQRLADSHREKNDEFADQMLQTLILANASAPAPATSSSSATAAAISQAERDNYAAAISKLADAQIEKNDLVADQMLMTMLLADSADPANRRALEQLKDKYLKRAFQKTSEQTASSAREADR